MTCKVVTFVAHFELCTLKWERSGDMATLYLSGISMHALGIVFEGLVRRSVAIKDLNFGISVCKQIA